MKLFLARRKGLAKSHAWRWIPQDFLSFLPVRVSYSMSIMIWVMCWSWHLMSVYFLWILMDVKLMAPVAKWTTLLVLVVPWSYYPFNWPYMGITGFITAINGLTRLWTKLVGAHFCGIFQHWWYRAVSWSNAPCWMVIHSCFFAQKSRHDCHAQVQATEGAAIQICSQKRETFVHRFLLILFKRSQWMFVLIYKYMFTNTVCFCHSVKSVWHTFNESDKDEPRQHLFKVLVLISCVPASILFGSWTLFFSGVHLCVSQVIPPSRIFQQLEGNIRVLMIGKMTKTKIWMRGQLQLGILWCPRKIVNG